MRAPLRLARSICSARPSRLVLLSAAVAMSVVLISVVALVTSSLSAALKDQIDTQVGTAEVRVRAVTGGTMPERVIDEVSTWDGVDALLPRLQGTLTLAHQREAYVESSGGYTLERDAGRASVYVNGVDPSAEFDARPVALLEGRYPSADGEILIDARVAQRLSWAFAADEDTRRSLKLLDDPIAYINSDAPSPLTGAPDAVSAERYNAALGPRVGDTLTVVKLFGERTELEIVGIAQAPPIGGKPIAYVTRATLERVTGDEGRISDLEITLVDGVDAQAFVDTNKDAFEGRAIVQTTERVTAGVQQNLAASRLAFLVVSVISLMSAAFIIMTGLTTGIAEQQRTLGVLRCLGAERRTLASAQLFVGVIVSLLGVAAGLPLGLLITFIVARVFERHLTQGVVVEALPLTLTILGAIAAGVLGSLWPAYRAARLSPMQAVRQHSPTSAPKQITLVTTLGLLGIAIQMLVVLFIPEKQMFFWVYVGVGLPLMFIGYFLVAVPLVVLVAQGTGPVISRVFGLPRTLLTRTVRATPYRHGFTAGALMTGMALLIGIWTNSSAAMRDWIDKIEFPDAFAYGLPMREEAIEILNNLDVVENTCAISMLPVETDAFGVEALSNYKTNYFGFEPESFFEMVNVEFVQGDQATALAGLKRGGCVIVAREFLVARGLGVGDEFVCQDADGEEHVFEIVGVVTSPGLELVSQYFDLGDNLVSQAVSSVFGSRSDMIEHFGVREPMLIQIDLDDSVPPSLATRLIEEALAGSGVLNVGSGQRIREQIEAVFASSFVVVSTVALGAMLVACFGVANLIVAEIHARRYELGVLRAVGASKAQVLRLVCGQALIIALTASVAGTLLGLQAAWGGQQMNRLLLGIDLTLAPPIGPIVFSWGAAIVLSLLAALPSAQRISSRTIRTLMSGSKL